MKKRAIDLVVGAIAAAATFLAWSPASAQPLDPTHYWTYHLVQPLDQPVTFEARDQFFPEYRPLVAMRLERLLNPAWKYHNGQVFPPRDSTAHLTWWDLPDEPVTRLVRVDNQFGEDQMLQVSMLDFMLLPARKDLTPGLPEPPSTINHYLCYRVVGPSPGIPVTLRDQFHQQEQLVASATYLCNPCWKRHAGVEYAPYDDTHLVLYRLEIPNYQGPERWLRDQFAAPWLTSFVQVPDEYLAVPSTKEEISNPTERTTWGRIKEGYKPSN